MNPSAPAPTLDDFFAAWDLFRDPVVAAIVAGATLGYLGVYIVLRRMVFVSAALSQAAGLGVAFAFYAEIALGASGLFAQPLVWATAFTLLTTLVLAKPGREGWLSRESVLGWVYLVGSAGALIVGTRIQQEAHEISSILFGTAVLVTPPDLHLLLAVCAVVMVMQVFGGRGFRFASFDPDGAKVRGLPVALLDTALFASIAIVVSFATRVLGALPIFAFSVLPAMAAILVVPSVRNALALATVLGAISGGLGYFVSFRFAWPVGASQAATGVVLVLATTAVRAVLQRVSAARAPLRASVRPAG
jgi:zinc transport system permease protein